MPYPVQILGTEVLLEFIGSADGTRRRRGWLSYARTRPTCPTLWRSWSRRCPQWRGPGCAHGDLSAYNLLVQDGRLVVIDLPQIVDVVSNPQGREFLARDARNVATWFAMHGVAEADGDELARLLAADAGLTARSSAMSGGMRASGRSTQRRHFLTSDRENQDAASILRRT